MSNCAKTIASRVSISDKPNSRKNEVLNNGVSVSVVGSIYLLNIVSTKNSSVVISWLKNHVLGCQDSIPVCIIQKNDDLVLGILRNNEVLLYQLHQPQPQTQRVPDSVLHLVNDDRKLQFIGFKIQDNLIQLLKGFGFELRISEAKEITAGKKFKEFTELGDLISSKDIFQEHVEGSLVQQNSVILSCLHLLRASLLNS
ncbi:uncharacterized protein LOC113288642 [Papaver somniferum]|uniref:uncharacterized protein LOC113288642 n=1 Tax=Papaver somniferum TaxID=3469 RepID=UPI000E700724|nr:uncharacterized protein LOC113288642 [Papaver somniferum]XP_026393519.1 uncharacterized protein LOC113288642 [Papaver somniferum]